MYLNKYSGERRLALKAQRLTSRYSIWRLMQNYGANLDFECVKITVIQLLNMALSCLNCLSAGETMTIKRKFKI